MIPQPSCSETISELHFKTSEEIQQTIRNFLDRTKFVMFASVSFYNVRCFIQDKILQAGTEIPANCDALPTYTAILIPIEPEWLVFHEGQEEKKAIFSAGGMGVSDAMFNTKYTINLRSLKESHQEGISLSPSIQPYANDDHCMYLWRAQKEITEESDQLMVYCDLVSNGLSLELEIHSYEECDAMKAIVSVTKNYRYYSDEKSGFWWLTEWLACHDSFDLIIDPYIIYNLHIDSMHDFTMFLEFIESLRYCFSIVLEDLDRKKKDWLITVPCTTVKIKDNNKELIHILAGIFDPMKNLQPGRPDSMYPTKDITLRLSEIPMTQFNWIPVIRCSRFKFPLSIFIQRSQEVVYTRSPLLKALEGWYTEYRFDQG